METLVILDYSTPSVHFYNISPSVVVDEEYIESLGFHLSSCSWMTGNMDIFHHKGILK